MRWKQLGIISVMLGLGYSAAHGADRLQVREAPGALFIETDALTATIKTTGYVSGVSAGSLVDRKTGAHDLGFGLDIVDWLMEPGSDESYRDKLDRELVYEFNNPHHGKIAKRSIEGPQICTKAKSLTARTITGSDFIAITQDFTYKIAAPGKNTGSKWDQILVFPAGKRYFISSDRITSANDSDSLFLRIDMPGHIKHNHGDTFSEVYLSYLGEKPIPSSEFINNFAPDDKFRYVRPADPANIPRRLIRAYHIRDPKTGASGPWLAGMTLRSSAVSEAWCHQRGYVCMIEEFGGRPIKAKQQFSAAFIVGFFDSIAEMHEVYDAHAGSDYLEVDVNGWRLMSR